jgi:hypothetical protein
MNEDILAQLGQGQPAPAEEPKEEIKYKDKKKSSGKQIDDEVLNDLLMNGDNTKGMITPSEKERKKANDDEELHKEPDEEAKIEVKGSAKPSKKYETEFQKDMMKNPEEYFINTPKGEMSVKEAMEQGYDPITHRFNLKEQSKNNLDEQLKDLNDSDKEAIKRLFDPKQVGLAPADAEEMGIDPMNPTIKREEDPADLKAQPTAPAIPAMPEAGMVPPQGGDQPLQGGNPLEALLGGGQ